MKRRPRFLVMFLTALLTFGTLMATVGPRHFRNFKQCHSTEVSEKTGTNAPETSK